MSKLAEILERFRRGGELVAEAARGAAGTEVDFAPAPGKWSIRQIAAHVADAETVGVDRFRRVLAEDHPTLMAFDQEAWARNLDYSRRDMAQSIETFRRLRRENFELLKDMPEAAFARTGDHSERGPVTVLDLLSGYTAHAESHARQIREVRRAYQQRA